MKIKVLCCACQTAFAVDESKLGSTVACPECLTNNEVMMAAEADGDEMEADVDEYRLADDDVATPRPSLEADLLREAELSPASKSEAARPRPSVGSPGAAPASPLPESSGPSGAAVCKKCGASLAADALECDSCGQETKLKELADKDETGGATIRELPPGFRGWVEGHLSEGESVESMVMWVEVAVGFVLIVLSWVFRWWFLFISVPIVVAFIGITIINAMRRGKGEEPITWYFLLSFARLTRWGFFKGPFAKRQVFDARGKSFADSDLESIKDPQSLDAIDLEGFAQVTNASLEYLKQLRDLKFLVIRRTNISHDAYCELQEHLRKTWIWY